KVIGHDVKIYDGGEGTARQLQRRLKRDRLLRKSGEHGQVEMMNTLKEENIMNLSHKLLIKI
ncbi:hypothetical protein, partial [Aminipila sp.]